MVDVGRRAYLLFSLPAPGLETSAIVITPLTVPHAIDAEDKRHNELVVQWWQQRRFMGAAVRNVQTETVAQLPSTADECAAGLYDKVAQVYGHALSVGRQWASVFNNLYKRGSTFRTAPEFVSRWCTLGPTQLGAVYEYGACRVLTEIEHSSLSIVFESVCMAYLQCALLQQMSTLAYVARRHAAAPAASGTLLPTEFEIVPLLRRAIDLLKTLVNDTLPLYFEARNGTEPYLMAVHFYRAFLSRLLAAQMTWLTATFEFQVGSVSSLINSAALFAHSSRTLAAAQRTPYAEADLLGEVAAHRQSSALITLSTALHNADKISALEPVLDYGGMQSDELTDFRALAIEAFYCARAAYALTPSVKTVQQQYERIARRLCSMYATTVPDPPVYDLPFLIIHELRRCGATNDDVWKREYGQVVIEVRLCATQQLLMAVHAKPSSGVVGVGSKKRYFVIDSLYNPDA